MPRTCFVIMPFSATSSCSEDEWTSIFERLFKSAVENAGMDYICKRSVATRGNIVGAIIRDLNDAHLILADLTDRNANVFYELGVRHALKDRCILLAQKREDIPFDLQAYAYHIYEWRTPEGIESLTTRLKQLLEEIDNKPERPDNPVSDFLKIHKVVTSEIPPIVIKPTETFAALSLVGMSAEGLDASKLLRGLVERNQPNDAKIIFRLTKSDLLPMLEKTLIDFNEKSKPEQITKAEILKRSKDFLPAFESIVIHIEDFGLATAQEEWGPGIQTISKLSGIMISLSEKLPNGSSTKFSQGAPALMAWRILNICSALALAEENFASLNAIITQPIEVEESSNRFSHRNLLERLELFYPDAFLGHSDIPMQYLDGLWATTNHLQRFFDSEESYQLALAQYFIFLQLVTVPDAQGYRLFPSYRFLKQASRGMSLFTSKLFTSNEYTGKIASFMGLTSSQFIESWAERVKAINEISSGGWEHILSSRVRFPEKFGERI